MRIKNRWLSAAFKLCAFVAPGLGVLIQCGALRGEFDPTVLNYYTTISNILCCLYFLPACIYALRKNDTLWPIYKGALVMGITVTGMVYHFLLSGSFQMQGTMALSNVLLHYLTPALSLLDWLLFDDKGRYDRRSPWRWVLIPDLYFVYIVGLVAVGVDFGFMSGRYPYFFIDADTLGWGRVLLYVAALNLFFLALGYLFVLLDRALASLGRASSRA